uniref:Uncharacterized protein n=1 Tax=Anguilla anguilla TaxID=7936 RepID=A0A0E9TR06_ANGAN
MAGMPSQQVTAW